jgi:hypothetical protein
MTGSTRLATLAAVTVSLVAAVAPARTAVAATSPAPGWTKTYTEAILLLKLRVPCRQVRTVAGCSLERAELRLAQSRQRAAACKSRTTASAAASGCSDSVGAADAVANVTEIKRGFPIRTADCSGGTKSRLPGDRFGVFRCSITVDDDTNPGGPVVVSGRLLVTVTGKTTFSWQAI